MRNPSFLLEYVSFAFAVYFSNLRSDMTSVKAHPVSLDDYLPEGRGQNHMFSCLKTTMTEVGGT